MSSWHDDDAAAAVIVKQSGERRDETRVGDAQSTRSFRPFRSIFGTNELSFGAALISTVQEERRGEERRPTGQKLGSVRGASATLSWVARNLSGEATHSRLF